MYKQAKEHQIYYTKADYLQAIDKYNRDRPLAFSPQQLLLVAKGHFILGEYNDCLKVLKHIDPKYNTKILYQRQSLQFRALYLFYRHILPDIQHLSNLNQIIDVFDTLAKQVPGVPFKAQHYSTMTKYKQFLLFVEKQISMKIVLDKTLFKQQKELQARSQKFEGFPIYIISNQWIEDFNLALTKGQLKGQAYLCPLTNFAIINDLFEAYQHDDKFDQYKNTFIFQGVTTSTASKKYWNYLNSIINDGKEYCAVKRIFDSSSPYSPYSSSSINKSEMRRGNRFHPLIRTIIKSQEEELAIQLSSNKTLEEEFYTILEKRYGTGQLRIKEDDHFNLLDLQGQAQTCLGKINKILYFKKVEVPKNILPKQFHLLLQYQFNPVPKENLEDPENGLKGLQNIGNSCYLNSCLQCLSFTKELSSILVTNNTLSIINFDNRDGAVLAAIADLFKNLWIKDQRKRIFPRKFKRIFGLKNTQFSERTQEDAHQFLLCVLNNLHQELKVVRSRLMRTFSKLQITTDKKKVRQYFERNELQENKSAVMNIIRGKIHNTMDCSFCKSQSHSYDIFLALTLPVPQKQSKHMDIYFCGYDTRLTKKYRIHVDEMKDFEELLSYVKTIFRKLADNQYYYIFGEINKENLMFREMVAITQSEIKYLTEVTIELLAKKSEKFDYIFYQMKKKEVNEVLMLLEYRYEKDGLIIGFPRLMQIQQRKIQQRLYYLDLKRDIADNDKENFFKSFDIDGLHIKKLSQIRRIDGNPNIFDYIVQVVFRVKEKLFNGTSDIFEEFNDPNIKYSIYDCLDLMKKPQVLVDSWQCGNCKKIERVEKRQLIVDINNILIIHLKRFKADYRKIKTMIDYPIKGLDIGPWIEQKGQSTTYKYNLYAVCLHTGTAESGHYKAYCKHFASDIWYEFDDGSVQKIEQSDVVTPNAYVLFYRRSEAQ